MWIKVLLVFFVFSFTFRIDLSFNQDLGRHIKIGEIITKTFSVPNTNLFSYTNPNFHYINTHWLFGVIAYFFSQTIGLHALLVLKIIILLTSVWLTLKTIPKGNQILLLPIGFIFLHVLRERIELRPEIFSFLFTAFTYYVLEKKSRLLFLLPLIQLVWINIHIYFFVGLMLQVIFLIQKRQKMFGIILIVSLLASLFNPNGLNGFLYPLNVNQNYGYTIAENQTMFLLESIQFRDPNFLWVKISAILIVLSLGFSLFKKRVSISNFSVAIFGLALALLNIRSFPYLVFLSLPAIMLNLGTIKKNQFITFLSIIAGLLLILESFFYLNGDYYKYRDEPHKVGLGFEENVRKAMDFVVQNKLPASIYNNFDIGSYIIYKGYPDYQVFVDGRPEAYPKEFFLDTYIPSQSDYLKFKDLETKKGVNTIIFSHTDQTPWGKNFLTNLVKDPDFKLVYIDDFMLIFVKNEQIDQKKLSPIDLSKIQSKQFQFDNHVSYLRLGIFLISNGFTENGSQFIIKALQINPNSPTGNMILGNQIKNNFFW